MPDSLQRTRVWLAALVIANGVVAAVLYGGVLNWLDTPVMPERSSLEQSVRDRWICATWGPFADSAFLDGLISEIELAGGETEVITRRFAAAPDYMVLVGPQGSFESARRVRDELASQSIDSRIVPAGPLARSLEVGIFPDRALALVRQARVEELGYNVDLKEMQRGAAAFHLVARLERKLALTLPPATNCGVIAPGHRFL